MQTEHENNETKELNKMDSKREKQKQKLYQTSY